MDQREITRKLARNFITPVGLAQFCFVNSPHSPSPNAGFVADPVYKTNLILTREEAAPLIEQLEKIVEEYKEDYLIHCARVKKPQLDKVIVNDLYHEEYDDDGHPTGNVIFKFKLKPTVGKGDRQREQRPDLFDSKKKKIKPEEVRISSGSKIAIGFSTFPYFVKASRLFGLSLQLRAVQVVELNSGGSGFDFGVHDGFTSDEEVSSKLAEVEEEDDGSISF